MDTNKLAYKKKHAGDQFDADMHKEISLFSEDYKHFLDTAKTERLCAQQIISQLTESGFSPFTCKDTVQPGDKFFWVNRNKMVVAAVVGKHSPIDGLRFIAAHLDSPRLDLKPMPLYEDCGLSLLKTHYYGGIRKYQWVTLPLALHGIIIKENGEQVNISIGDKEQDPVFYISDLLPHLSKDLNNKKSAEFIEGEALNILIGNMPCPESESKERVKAHILDLLYEQFGIGEEDFMSAEIEAVPAGKSRDLGLDRSMICAYGHDDRCCAYSALRALQALNEIPEYTSFVIFADKEEIGSVGNTSMSSMFVNNSISSLIASISGAEYSERLLQTSISHSKMLSADVTAAMDPTYISAFEKRNDAMLGHGVALVKYTGARGKSGASDANAEYVWEIRNICKTQNIPFQMCEMGKVDQGGGGTIAYIGANAGMDVLDAGIPVISMHAPFEVISKCDLYSAYLLYLNFLLNK